MKKKQNKRKAGALPKAASPKNNPPQKKKKFVPLYPLDLPLSDTWYTYSDLIIMIKVERGAIHRYSKRGLLRAHRWGRTVRFNKAYVDWMFENGGKKFTLFGWLVALTHNFDRMVDMMAA
jgi:hypothetical protein